MEELFLLRAGFSDAAQAKLTAIGGGQNDVGTLERGEPCQGSGWREVRMISPQQMFQRHPQRTAQKRHQDVRLDARSEEHTSELQSLAYLVCRLLLEKKK